MPAFAALHPSHAITARCGYFGYRGSLLDSVHNTKVDPRSEVIVCACWQHEQRPGQKGAALACHVRLSAQRVFAVWNKNFATTVHLTAPVTDQALDEGPPARASGGVVGEGLRGELLDQLLDPRALAGDLGSLLVLRPGQIIEKSVQLGVEALFAMKTHGYYAATKGGKISPTLY